MGGIGMPASPGGTAQPLGTAGTTPQAIASAGIPGTGSGTPNAIAAPIPGNSVAQMVPGTVPGAFVPGTTGAPAAPGTPAYTGNTPGIPGLPGTPGSPGTGTPGSPGTGTPGVSGAPAKQGTASATAPGTAGQEPSGPSFNGAALPPGFGSEKPLKTPATPTLSKILGNKDFVITIDCYADHVTLFPGGAQFRWTTQNVQATDSALVASVAKLIERRQAAVRPGEPPYRPIIRFQVSAEGLRSYYHVYPLLEHLRIPMTRENVED
jgi:hypothetical protein